MNSQDAAAKLLRYKIELNLWMVTEMRCRRCWVFRASPVQSVIYGEPVRDRWKDQKFPWLSDRSKMLWTVLHFFHLLYYYWVYNLFLLYRKTIDRFNAFIWKIYPIETNPSVARLWRCVWNYIVLGCFARGREILKMSYITKKWAYEAWKLTINRSSNHIPCPNSRLHCSLYQQHVTLYLFNG